MNLLKGPSLSVSQVVEDHALFQLGGAANGLDVALVLLEQDPERPGHVGIGGDLGQRPADEIADERLRQRRIAVVLDEGHEAQRRLFQLDRHLGVGEERAVDDLGPVNQLGERRLVEAELGGDGVGQELGAALGLGIVELAAGGVGAEVVLVAGQLERRGVVVEPPGEARVLRVAEVDAGVLVAVEVVGGERLRVPLVLERPVEDLQGPLGNPLAVEPGEHPRGAASIEAVAVVQHAQAHR